MSNHPRQSDSKPVIRAAMLGCGRVAAHYRFMLLETDPVPSLRIVACCDRIAARAEECAAAFQCPAYTCFETMMRNEALDVVLVLTPSGTHFELARSALEHDLHALVEKPITLRPEQALELKRLAQHKRRCCATVFQNRYNPAVRAVRSALERGRFKKLVSISVRLRWCRYQSYYDDPWHGQWAQDGGVTSQQAIHHLDAARWLGGPVERVTAFMTNRLNALEAEDTLVGIMEFRCGALGTIEATTAARPSDMEASLSIVGEGGTVQIGGIALNQIVQWQFVEPDPSDEDAEQAFSETVPSAYGLSHSRLIRDFADALQQGRPVAPVSIDEALPTIELVHALYASVESGAEVSLQDRPRSKRLGIAPSRAPDSPVTA